MQDDQLQNTPEPENVQQQTPEAVQAPELEQDSDWRRVRDQRKADRKAREEAEARAMQKAEEAAALKAALEAMTNKPSPVFNTGYSEETEDERLNKLVEAKMQQLEKQREQERAKKELAEAPQKIRQVYKDFDQVCSPENMDYVDYHNPELTAPFKYMPDGFEKWELMYKATKKLLPNPQGRRDAQKVDSNLAKPSSISAIPSIPATGQAVRLSEERKAENYLKMQRIMKGLS